MAMSCFCFHSSLLVSFFLGIAVGSYGQKVPGIYVFGDSLIDVGNNNYLQFSIAKANYPQNGIDFKGSKATGRFSNGKNAADFIAEMVGLPTSPPYLSLLSNQSTYTGTSLTGVSFASAAAGIFGGTDDIYKQFIPLSKQVEDFQTVHGDLMTRLGSTAARGHFGKSLFVITIGSNDVFGYSGSFDLQNNYTYQQYADLMASSLKQQLQRLYSHNARKFLMVGLGPIGCCPSQRLKNGTDCTHVPNQLVLHYNPTVLAMLESFKSEFKDMAYSFLDTYSVMQTFIHNPHSYGFREVRAACCGLGLLNAQFACFPFSTYCSNRTDHLFWDLYHPTEEAAKMLVERAFNGDPPNTFPVNVRKMIHVEPNKRTVNIDTR